MLSVVFFIVYTKENIDKTLFDTKQVCSRIQQRHSSLIRICVGR